MSVKVSLREVIDQLELEPPETVVYVNKKTGAIVPVTDEDMALAEAEGDRAANLPDWQREVVQEARAVLDSEDDYIALPDTHDIHEYRIIEEFCVSLTNDKQRTDLLGKIRGAGAFRRFKDAIRELGIAEEWYRFRLLALKAIAIDWLDENHIPYTDDTEKPSGAG
jgi:hypothetical protein